MNKTNAIRIIESLGIEFKTYQYEFDDEDLSGTTVAQKIGVEPDRVFKTLVCINDRNEIFIFCIPVISELNLKKAASASGNKKLEMLKMKDLFPTTGYVRGGCSPIGMKKKFPVFIDETAQLFEKIFISAGTRGMQIEISANDLITAVDGSYADLI
ncbi:MAG: Cys-tRNA(Pro) deacylase [Ignavibacteriaceae bacterium]|nr:Cys-tRNA(Pro) deacylase [Ignavibacteriaceae bacterium]